MTTHLLLLEDDDCSRESLSRALEQDGFAVTTCASAAEAVQLIKRQRVDVGVYDVMLEGAGGLEVLDYTVRNCPDAAVIMVTGYGTVELAVQAMKRGASDFLTKPIDLDRLTLLIHRSVRTQRLRSENRRLRAALRERFSVGRMRGRSARMQALFHEIERVATTDATVLLAGESGVGKELCANAIHFHSGRHDGPLVKVSCAALGSGVLESELFGHERGAFTGAIRSRLGRFEQAHGGTIFLDEVADIPPSTQVKLLRVLQEREIERVGSNKPVEVDVRVIAATNRDLREAVAEGRFREDLFYRLDVVTIEVPPLRERAEDIPVLVQHFLDKFNTQHDKRVEALSKRALGALTRYRWPGNVRELRNCIESLVVTTRSRVVDSDELPAHLRQAEGGGELRVPIGSSLAEVERQLVLATLAAQGGNKTQTARVLDIGLKTLYRRLESYAVDE